MPYCPLLALPWDAHPGAVCRDLDIGAKVFLPHSQWMENMQVKHVMVVLL